ncbi:helix-turn-helix domain-containing protein [Stappia sp. ICDLI1TA098]
MKRNDSRVRQDDQGQTASAGAVVSQLTGDMPGIDDPARARVGLCSVSLDSAGTQAAMQPWIGMECYQLGSGRRLGQMDIVDVGGRQVVRERQDVAVQKVGVTPRDLCTISCCTHHPSFRFSDHCAGNADTVFFMPENTEFDLYVPDGTQTAYVSLSQEAFLAAARVLDPAGWERPEGGVMQLRSAGISRFSDTVALWFDAVSAAQERKETVDPRIMHDLLLQMVLQAVSAPASGEGWRPSAGTRARALRVGRMAREYVEDRLDADVLPTVVDICRSIGVSERALQYAFREYVGMAPVAYLRNCRINRVRETLRVADRRNTTVTEVAMRFGFLHLGRFSSDYKRLFGETPSATLAT